MTGALARIEAGHLARSPLLLMGLALGVAVGGWVGLAVGRLSGSRMVSVLAAPLWVGLYLAVAQDARLALSVQNLSPVLGLYNRSAAYGFLPDPLWPHLGYLLGLTLLVGTLVLAVASRGGGAGRRRVRCSRRPRPVCCWPARAAPGCSPCPTAWSCSGRTGPAGSRSRTTSTPSAAGRRRLPAGASRPTGARGPAPGTPR